MNPGKSKGPGKSKKKGIRQLLVKELRRAVKAPSKTVFREWLHDVVDRGVKVAQIAAACGVTPATVYRWLDGSWKPGAEGAVRVAIAQLAVATSIQKSDQTHEQLILLNATDLLNVLKAAELPTVLSEIPDQMRVRYLMNLLNLRSHVITKASDQLRQLTATTRRELEILKRQALSKTLGVEWVPPEH